MNSTSFFQRPRYYQFNDDSPDSFRLINNVPSDLLVLYKSDEFSESHRTLLNNILSAIEYSMDKILLVEIENPDRFSMRLLQNQTPGVKKILAFGIEPVKVGFRPHIQKYRYYCTEQFAIMFSDSLQDLDNNTSGKQQLWKVLKKHFI